MTLIAKIGGGGALGLDPERHKRRVDEIHQRTLKTIAAYADSPRRSPPGLVGEFVQDIRYLAGALERAEAALAALKACPPIPVTVDHATGHHWREPMGNEPQDIGGVCVRCGVYSCEAPRECSVDPFILAWRSLFRCGFSSASIVETPVMTDDGSALKYTRVTITATMHKDDDAKRPRIEFRADMSAEGRKDHSGIVKIEQPASLCLGAVIKQGDRLGLVLGCLKDGDKVLLGFCDRSMAEIPRAEAIEQQLMDGNTPVRICDNCARAIEFVGAFIEYRPCEACREMLVVATCALLRAPVHYSRNGRIGCAPADAAGNLSRYVNRTGVPDEVTCVDCRQQVHEWFKEDMAAAQRRSAEHQSQVASMGMNTQSQCGRCGQPISKGNPALTVGCLACIGTVATVTAGVGRTAAMAGMVIEELETPVFLTSHRVRVPVGWKVDFAETRDKLHVIARAGALASDLFAVMLALRAGLAADGAPACVLTKFNGALICACGADTVAEMMAMAAQQIVGTSTDAPADEDECCRCAECQNDCGPAPPVDTAEPVDSDEPVCDPALCPQGHQGVHGPGCAWKAWKDGQA